MYFIGFNCSFFVFSFELFVFHRTVICKIDTKTDIMGFNSS